MEDKKISIEGVKLSETHSSLFKLTMNGFQWQSFSTIVQILLNLLVGMILARLLNPEDFGIVGYAMIFIGFSNRLTEVGIAPALIQLRNLTKRHISAAFSISLGTGVLVWSILWIIAPFLTKGNSTEILRALSIVFLINSPAMISGALLQRQLNFYRIFLANTISYFVGYGLVAIYLAIHQFGVWSLVWASLTQSITRSILLLIFSPYSIIQKFGKIEIESLLKFGSGMTLARLANFGASNLDYFVIGQTLGNEALGLYQRSFQIVTISITRIAGVLTSVLFPAFSKLQEDHEKLQRGYLSSISIISFVSVPLMTFIAISSREIVLTLYGDKWVGAIGSFAILSLNAIFISIFTLGDALARAKGLVFHQFRRHSLYALLVFVFAFIGSRYSIEGVATGVTSATFIMYLMMAQLSLRTIHASWKDFVMAQLPGLFMASVILFPVGFTGVLGHNWTNSNVAILLIKIVVGIFTILGIFLISPRNWLGIVPELVLIQLRKRNLSPKLAFLISFTLDKKKGKQFYG